MNAVAPFTLKTGLIQTAEVFTEDPTTGAFTVVANASLACRMGHYGSSGTDRLPPPFLTFSRGELDNLFVLIWGPAYTMPERCQLLISSVRWNPIVGSFLPMYDLNGGPAFNRCAIARVQT